MPLFVGAIPKPVVEQALKVVDLEGVEDVYVCCSGSFRLEQALSRQDSTPRLHANDVSLLSCALGGIATGQPLSWRFTEKLAFLDGVAGDKPLMRLGALAVAVQMSHWSSKNEFARAHYRHYELNAERYVAQAAEKLAGYLALLKLHAFSACDFRDHARAATAGDLGRTAIFAWPPTYRGGYEQLYKLLDANTDWERPSYRVWDPERMPEWLDELDAAGARYAVCADHELEGRAARALFVPGRARSIYLYASGGRDSSLRCVSPKSRPFKYTELDPDDLGPKSVVQLARVDSATLNFAKDRFLKQGLVHSDGESRWLVFIDGKLAGGFAHSPDRMGGDPAHIYLTCDFAVNGKHRMAKLIAMLATGSEATGAWNRRRLVRAEKLLTTAFTDKPVSMKYRGIYELVSRKPGFLNYASAIRGSTAEIYADWWKRYGRAAPQGDRAKATG